MSSVHNKGEEEYNSSSDEDYDPSKDTDFDPQDEIDDAEGGEEDIEEDVEKLNERSSSDKTTESSTDSPNTEGDVDVDAIFAELTGFAPSASNSSSPAITTSDSSKHEEKHYPKPHQSTGASEQKKVYPKKPQTHVIESNQKPVGTKRVGLLDAAKALSKRPKMSILDRSDQDWKDFTAQNNLKEDLESHNRGKGGYLNKMEFLSRTDSRQFEKERAFRATARKDT